jgi:hypothetical protein
MMAWISFRNVFGQTEAFDCRRAQELMSEFIDSMSEDEDSRRLTDHIESCPPCRRQLQGFISLRSFVSGMGAPEVPEDLALETRIRLSHVRSGDPFGQLAIRAGNILKPLTFPAMAGILATLACFGILLGSFGPSLTAQALDSGRATLWVYTEPRMTDPLLMQLMDLQLDELTVEATIDQKGKAFGDVVLTGAEDPEVDTWLRDVVLLGNFYPGTVYGRPVVARLIHSISFVRVTG